MSKPTTNIEPCTADECKLLEYSCQHAAWPDGLQELDGLTVACTTVILYSTRQHQSRECCQQQWPGVALCLFQPQGKDAELAWQFYSDSDQSSNTKAAAKHKSQVSYITT